MDLHPINSTLFISDFQLNYTQKWLCGRSSKKGKLESQNHPGRERQPTALFTLMSIWCPRCPEIPYRLESCHGSVCFILANAFGRQFKGVPRTGKSSDEKRKKEREKLSCPLRRASKDGMLSFEKNAESLILAPQTEVLTSSHNETNQMGTRWSYWAMYVE